MKSLRADGDDIVLRLRDVSHSFAASKENFEQGVHRVLDRVSFEVRRGEVLGVVGKNGVGKTTLLRLMAGILAPRSGTIEKHPQLSCALLSLGLGFQPQISGRDNARLSAMLQGANAAEAEEALEPIKRFAEIGESFEEPVKTYSAGMRARLGFATAMFTHVDILLIDEVLAVGDAAFRNKARLAMEEKLAGDQTVVLVSHVEHQIKTLCDRALLLESGRKVAEGHPAEVFQRYGN